MLKYTFLCIFIVLSASVVMAQNIVYFHVSTSSGEDLTGATIRIEGTATGTITDMNGRAQLINLQADSVKINISFIGFKSQNILLIFPSDNQKLLEIQLEENEEELEEVVISTTRSSRTIEDIPTRIEVITGEELGEKAAMNSSNIGMLLKETTGVLIQQTSLSSGNMSIRIQGLDGRYTQILKDGFPLYGGFAGGLSIMQIPPLDLKQIELIKGSNSTLYGGGAIAGLVNLVSIVPEDKPKLDIMLNQTSALGTTGNIFYAQKYDKLGLSLYGSANNQVAYDPDKDGFSNMPDAKSFSLNPNVYYYINSKSVLNAGLSMMADNRTGGDMEVLNGNANPSHVFSEKNISRRYSAQIRYSHANEKRTITLKNSFSYFNRELTIPGYKFMGDQLSGFSEIAFHLHKNDKADWLFGANYYLEQFAEDPEDLQPPRDYEHNTLGLFIQNTTNLGPKFIFEGGLRTDYNVDYGTFMLPRISLLFKPNRKFTSRIGGALGYKLPTIFTEDAEKLYYRNISPLSNKISTETSAGGNLDFNYKALISKKITFSINQLFFLTQLKNSLVLKENNGMDGYFFENADGNVLSSGFETNIKFTYADFKLFMNYSYIHTELLYDHINNQKPLSPKHNAGFVFMYEVEQKWSVGYELYFTGHQFDNLYDEKPGFWIMGFMVMRHIKKLVLFINFENFTNVIQTDFEPLVQPPTNDPAFPDIWAPSDGFIFNGGIKWSIF